VFEPSEALGQTLMNPEIAASWEPLRDLIFSGLEAGVCATRRTRRRFGPLPASWRRRSTPAGTGDAARLRQPEAHPQPLSMSICRRRLKTDPPPPVEI